MMHCRSEKARGFSLIEVLIAVLVLAVGLLGIASVFPVVISQQRDATDVIRGGVASAAVREQIRSNPDIADELLSQDGFADIDEPDEDGDRVPNETIGNDGDATIQTGVEPIFGQDGQFQAGFFDATEERFNSLTGFSYLWEADWSWGADNGLLANGPLSVPIGTNLLNEYVMDGGIRLRDPEERLLAGVTTGTADIPVLARLYPRPYSIEGSARDGPQYVWDFVPRRTARGSVQCVVFIRRIDNGIQIPTGSTLTAVLAANTGNRVYPVGRDTATGLPTLNGTGEYSVPVSAKAEPIPAADYPFRPEFRNNPNPDQDEPLLDGVRVTLVGDSEIRTVQFGAELGALADIGQRFVDNLGVVRTVVEVLDVTDNFVDLRVTPGYSRSTLLPAFGSPDIDTTFSSLEAARIGKLRQIVFTPHKPVDVFTMEFTQ